MTIKEFKVGQTAYIVNPNFHRNKKPDIRDTKIIKIGRKYITVGGERVFDETFDDKNFLVEKVNYGTPSYLFSSTEEVEEYIKCRELEKWIYNAVKSGKISQCSLEQLQELKKILEIVQ